MKNPIFASLAAMFALSLSSCSAEEKKDPNIWITLAELNAGKSVQGFYVQLKPNPSDRYDLMISTELLEFKDERIANEEVVIVPDAIQVFIDQNQWVELNYRKDSRSGIRFVRTSFDGVLGKYPIQIQFYDEEGRRRSIYLIKDLEMKNRFFPQSK